MFKGYGITSFLHTTPFEWKTFADGPQTAKLWKNKVTWRLNALLAVAQAIFAGFQCWRLNLHDSGNKAHQIYLVFSAVLYNFDAWLQLANLQNQTRLPRFVRGYMDFFRNVERKYLIRNWV